MAKKILVTGGCGYIGAQTILELIKATDFEIVSLDSLFNSSTESLRQIAQITGKQVVNFCIDMAQKELLFDFFEKQTPFDAVIHFAAHKAVGESVERPVYYYQNNLNSLLYLLEACQKFGIKQLIFSSSCSVYGDSTVLPVNEKSPLPSNALSAYANSKRMGEIILEDWVKSGAETSVVALRYFNPVGADMSGLLGENAKTSPTSLVPIIAQVGAGLKKELVVNGSDYPTRDGTCIRDYIHVSDIARAHVLALQTLFKQKLPPLTFLNLGSGNGVSILEAIQAYEKTSNLKVNYRFGPRREGDVVAIYSDSTLAETLIGWKAQLSIEQMMWSAWKWQDYLLTNHL